MTRLFYTMDFRFSEWISRVKWLYNGTLSISLLNDEIWLVKLAERTSVQAFFQIFMNPCLEIKTIWCPEMFSGQWYLLNNWTVSNIFSKMTGKKMAPRKENLRKKSVFGHFWPPENMFLETADPGSGKLQRREHIPSMWELLFYSSWFYSHLKWPKNAIWHLLISTTSL